MVRKIYNNQYNNLLLAKIASIIEVLAKITSHRLGGLAWYNVWSMLTRPADPPIDYSKHWSDILFPDIYLADVFLPK